MEYRITLDASDSSTVVEKSLDEIAHGLGFVRDDTGKFTDFDRGLGLETSVRSWKLADRHSTTINVFRFVGRNKYDIIFTDSLTGGLDLLGLPCRKWQAYSSALEQKFLAPTFNLTFEKRVCDPTREPPRWYL